MGELGLQVNETSSSHLEYCVVTAACHCTASGATNAAAYGRWILKDHILHLAILIPMLWKHPSGLQAVTEVWCEKRWPRTHPHTHTQAHAHTQAQQIRQARMIARQKLLTKWWKYGRPLWVLQEKQIHCTKR